MTRVRIGEIKLHVVERGSGLPLVLVHGFPLDHTMWQAQIDDLSNHFRVIAPDLRGFGQSDVTAGTVTMEQHADDLANLLDVIGISEPVAFCGLSMGGYIGWQFWRHHRAKLSRLLLCDTRAIADTDESKRARHMMAERVLSEGAAAVVETMLPKLFWERTSREHPELISATSSAMAKTDPQGIAAALRGMAARPDMQRALGEIDLPALVICGEHDVISPVAEMQQIADSIPAASFVVVPNAGHMAPVENPPATNAAIRAFLDE
mgnify:CR=1 FL=1